MRLYFSSQPSSPQFLSSSLGFDFLRRKLHQTTSPMAKKMTKSNSNSNSTQDWDRDLPDLALLSIAQKLANPVDFASFSSVCRSWRLVASDAVARGAFFGSLPPMIYSGRCSNFYNLVEKRKYRCRDVDVVSTTKSDFIGFSQGHLIFADGFSDPRYEIFLVNPFTGVVIRGFPTPTTRSKNRFRYKALLTSCPSSSPDWVILLLHEEYKTFARYARRGDKKWSVIRTKELHVRNTSVFDGRVVSMSRDGVLFSVVFSPGSELEIWDVAVLDVGDVCRRWRDRLCDVACYLVGGDDGGELLAVMCHMRWRHEFFVFRLDTLSRQWVKIESLGDRSLFMDYESCYLVEDPQRWGFCADCIYSLSGDMGGVNTFSIRDGDGEFLRDTRSYGFGDSWILPSLC